MPSDITQFPDDPLALLFQDAPQEDTSPRRRWYDQNPDLLIATETLRTLPLEHQKMVAEILMQTADLKSMAYPQEARLKNLGSDRILGLMSAQFRRRWYDKDVSLHKAFCALLLMPDSFRTIMGRKIGHSAQSIVAYTQWCQRSNLAVDIKMLKSRVNQVFHQDKLPSLMQPDFLKFFDEQTAQHADLLRLNDEEAYGIVDEETDLISPAEENGEQLFDQMWDNLEDASIGGIDDPDVEDSKGEETLEPDTFEETEEILGATEQETDAVEVEEQSLEEAGETQSTIATSEKGMQVKNQQVKPHLNKAGGKSHAPVNPKK